MGLPDLASLERPRALAGFAVARSPGPGQAKFGPHGPRSRHLNFCGIPIVSSAVPTWRVSIQPGGTVRCQDESPAVRRSIARHGPAQLVVAANRPGIERGDSSKATISIRRSPDGFFPSRPSAWSGENRSGSDEPPAIVALASLSSRELYRLIHASGQFKTVLAEDPHGMVAGRSLDSQRRAGFTSSSRTSSEAQEQVQAWASRDLQGSRGTKGWVDNVGLQAWG